MCPPGKPGSPVNFLKRFGRETEGKRDPRKIAHHFYGSMNIIHRTSHRAEDMLYNTKRQLIKRGEDKKTLGHGQTLTSTP